MRDRCEASPFSFINILIIIKMKKLKIYLAMTNIDKEAGHMASFEDKMKRVFGDMADFYKHNLSHQNYNPNILANCDMIICFVKPVGNELWNQSDYKIQAGTMVIGRGVHCQISSKENETIIFCNNVFYFGFTMERITPYSGNSSYYSKILLPKTSYGNAYHCHLPATYEETKIFYKRFDSWMTANDIEENAMSLIGSMREICNQSFVIESKASKNHMFKLFIS